MQSLDTIEVNDQVGASGQTAGAYERGEIVARLIEKAFERAQPSDKNMMINHLLGSVGVLSLATIANGVFLRRLFGGGSTDPWLVAGNVPTIDAHDIRDLAHRVQQVNAQAIDDMVEVFNALSLSRTSSVGAILAELPLRKTRRQHAD